MPMGHFFLILKFFHINLEILNALISIILKSH